MAEQNTAENLLKLILELQNFCETTKNQEFNKNIFSIRFKILFLINKYGKVSPSVLVEELNIAKSNIALFCKKLLNEKLIFSSQDEVDRRIIYYCLTSQGKKYVDKFVSLFNEHICQNLEENKLKTFDKNINSVCNTLLKSRSKNKDVKDI